MSNLLEDPAFIADLKSELSGRAVADKWPVSKSTVNEWRKNGIPERESEVPAGESEKHNPDGTSDYVRFSKTAWGFEDYRAFIKSKGQNPDEVTFTWGWTSNPGGGFWNKLNHVRPIVGKTPDALEDIDLPALYAAAKSASTTRPFSSSDVNGRATVIVWSDPQIGKTGRRGGTKELLERSQVIRHKLDALLTERRPERVLLADGGDGIEGFESGGNPMFTNDLSLPGQLDLYGTELFEFINLSHKHAPVTVMGVSSNHSAWRNGKQNLGIPADDLGLFMHKQTAKVTKAAGMSVDWVAPEPYDESVAFEFAGTTVGLVHGNQFSPGQAVQWWEKQTFGAGACVRADVLVHGHYHSFSANVAGRNPVSGRQRWCFGAPTLDNGSDWFRQTAGRDSDPGLLVFDVTADGFDIASLVIL